MPSITQQHFSWIFCGGDSPQDWDRIDGRSLNTSTLQEWIDRSPELKMLAKVSPTFFYSGNGSDLPVAKISEIAKYIVDHLDEFDGFVITHDIDQLLFHASLLAFMLQGTPKPILFTCSPFSYLQKTEIEAMTRSDRSNLESFGLSDHLVQSMQASAMGFQEVALMFHHRALRATRAVMNRRGVKVFESFEFPILGDLEFGVSSAQKIFRPPVNVKLRPKVVTDVVVGDARFQTPEQVLSGVKAQTTRGVLLRGHDHQPLSKEWREALSDSSCRNFPIGVISPTHVVEKEGGPAFLIQNQTWDASFAKFCWILGQTDNLPLIQKVMQSNVLGEKNEPSLEMSDGEVMEELDARCRQFQAFLDLEL